MKKTAALFGLCLLFTSFSVFAEGKADRKAMKKEMKKEMFEITKKESLSNLEKRIQHLQETKNCVSGASDGKALKNCRKEARQKGESLRAEMRQKQKERKAKRKERMQAKKN